MNCEIGILNESYDADEELIIIEHSGKVDDLPDDVLDTMYRCNEYPADLGAGDWITIVDGEVVSTGEFHPFLVRCQAD